MPVCRAACHFSQKPPGPPPSLVTRSAITIGAARIAGIADRVGSLTPGKDADIVITHGDPLDMLSRVRMVWIDGRLVKG